MPLVDSGKAFGGKLESKLIGTTLCALAHNVSDTAAVRFFANFFIDKLFGQGLSDYPGSKETIVAFLYDNHRAIMNEGVVHHLGAQFDMALDKLGSLYGLKASADANSREGMLAYQTESCFIEGFFRWLLKTNSDLPYYTRSAIVGRIAVCLRCIGYKVGDIIIWKGTGRRPNPPRGVVLVMGGSSDTDEFMTPLNSHHVTIEPISHYR